MGWRGLGSVLLLGALGLGVGLAVAFGLRPTAAPAESAAPLPAASPSVPLDPPPSIAPDPDRPPLPTSLRTEEELVGGQLFGVVVPVPVGWDGTSLASAESRWTLPGNPASTYSLRVEMVFGERLTIEEIMSERSEALDDAVDFTVVSQDDDTLVFTYIDETDHLRLQMLRWLSPRGTGMAEVEVAVNGRMRDEAGLEALLDSVTEGLRTP